jgi:hypothetical protein
MRMANFRSRPILLNKEPRYPLNGGLREPQRRSGLYEEGEISCPCRDPVRNLRAMSTTLSRARPSSQRICTVCGNFCHLPISDSRQDGVEYGELGNIKTLLQWHVRTEYNKNNLTCFYWSSRNWIKERKANQFDIKRSEERVLIIRNRNKKNRIMKRLSDRTYPVPDRGAPNSERHVQICLTWKLGPSDSRWPMH